MSHHISYFVEVQVFVYIHAQIYIYIYIYIYRCICRYTCIYMHVHENICIYIHMYVYIYIEIWYIHNNIPACEYTCTYIYTRTHVKPTEEHRSHWNLNTYACIYMCMCIHGCMCTHMNMYMCIYIHTCEARIEKYKMFHLSDFITPARHWPVLPAAFVPCDPASRCLREGLQFILIYIQMAEALERIQVYFQESQVEKKLQILHAWCMSELPVCTGSVCNCVDCPFGCACYHAGLGLLHIALWRGYPIIHACMEVSAFAGTFEIWSINREIKVVSPHLHIPILYNTPSSMGYVDSIQQTF